MAGLHLWPLLQIWLHYTRPMTVILRRPPAHDITMLLGCRHRSFLVAEYGGKVVGATGVTFGTAGYPHYPGSTHVIEESGEAGHGPGSG
jgi:hypothetical protein